MNNVNETFLVNLSQAVGISYDIKRNVLGAENNPNSALFNISQIASIVAFGKPIFGVFDDPNSFETIEFVNNGTQIEFRFSQGKVFYQRNLTNLASQAIPVPTEFDEPGSKLFKFYLDYNDFILASTVFSARITSFTDNVVVVDQLPSVSYLNNLNILSINNYLFNITSINSNTNTITLSQSVSAFANAGFTCTLIFQPIIKFISTFSSTTSAPEINIPSTGIILAEAEVLIGGSVGALTYSCPLGVQKLFEAYPEYSNPQDFFPNILAYNAFLNTTNNTLKAYRNVQNYTYENSLLNSFITYTQGVSSSAQTFDNYWKTYPYKPTNLFQYGIGFQGLQKTDFDPRFKDLYYYSKNIDLTRTLAIFRGDIYGGNAFIGQSLGLFQGSCQVLNLVDFTGNSTLSNGTYSYGASAVIPSGEYNPKFSSAANFYFNRRVNNYISYTSPTVISDLLFFHLYKNLQDQNGFQQQRITTPFELGQYTLSDIILDRIATTQGIAYSNFAFQIKSADSSSGFIGGIAFNAFIPDSGPLTGIQSCLIASPGSNYVNPYVVITGNGFGAAISLTTTAGGGIGSALVTSFGSGYTQAPTITVFDAQSNSGGTGAVLTPVLSQLFCGIYTGTSTNPVGTSIQNLQPIPISSIGTGLLMNMPMQGSSFMTLNSNTNYWAVFSMNKPYPLNTSQELKFFNSLGYSTSYATTNDFVNWDVSTTGVQIAKLGFADQGRSGNITSSRGVHLTGDKPATPLRLQIYIPDIDLSSLTFDDLGATVVGISSVALPIQNSMQVYVLAENSATGVQSSLVATIPQGTTRGTVIPLGTDVDLYDTVLDVFVSPDLSNGVNYITGTTLIDWTIYDTFVIDTTP